MLRTAGRRSLNAYLGAVAGPVALVLCISLMRRQQAASSIVGALPGATFEDYQRDFEFAGCALEMLLPIMVVALAHELGRAPLFMAAFRRHYDIAGVFALAFLPILLPLCAACLPGLEQRYVIAGFVALALTPVTLFLPLPRWVCVTISIALLAIVANKDWQEVKHDRDESRATQSLVSFIGNLPADEPVAFDRCDQALPLLCTHPEWRGRLFVLDFEETTTLPSTPADQISDRNKGRLLRSAYGIPRAVTARDLMNLRAFVWVSPSVTRVGFGENAHAIGTYFRMTLTDLKEVCTYTKRKP